MEKTKEDWKVGQESKFNYGYWNTEKKAEPGFSREFISADTQYILDHTNLEELTADTYPGVTTLFHAFKRNVERIPNHEMLGTRVDGAYQWKTWREVDDLTTNISYGIEALKLAPEIAAEGTTYKFIGIQSKNREEWTTLHIANMHMSITTIAFYDTLGPEASKFMIN